MKQSIESIKEIAQKSIFLSIDGTMWRINSCEHNYMNLYNEDTMEEKMLHYDSVNTETDCFFCLKKLSFKS